MNKTDWKASLQKLGYRKAPTVERVIEFILDNPQWSLNTCIKYALPSAYGYRSWIYRAVKDRLEALSAVGVVDKVRTPKGAETYAIHETA